LRRIPLKSRLASIAATRPLPFRRLILTVKRNPRNLKGVIHLQQAAVAALLVDRGEEVGAYAATGGATIQRTIF
jgi:hypothetical protein